MISTKVEYYPDPVNKRSIWARLGSEVFPYEEKCPFVLSGHSALSAVIINREIDRLQCHECGEWWASLAQHVPQSHGMDLNKYRADHRLGTKVSLVNDELRRRLSKSAGASVIRSLSADTRARNLAKARSVRNVKKTQVERSPQQNANGNCAVQVQERLRDLHRSLGRIPSMVELDTAKINTKLLRTRYGSMPEAYAVVLGVDRTANKGRIAKLKSASQTRYSAPQLVPLLISFRAAHGRSPNSDDCCGGFLPSLTTFKKCFGSWTAALKAAEMERRQRTTPRQYSDGELLDQLRRHVEMTRSAPNADDCCGAIITASYRTFRRRFRSWERALRQASIGVEPHVAKTLENAAR